MPEFRGKRFTDARMLALPKVDRIRFLSLYDTAVTDAGIEALRSAKKLEEIDIISDHITDESLCILCGLPKLVSLFIRRAPKITDAGLEYVSRALGLKELCLEGTEVTDRGLKDLLGLSQLSSLALSGVAVTDDGVRLLGQLDALLHLGLERTAVTGVGLVDFPNREYFGLYLEETPTDDKGVQAFSTRMTNLKNLNLSKTRVTDASATALRRLERLNVLLLNGCSITDETLDALHGHPTLEHLEIEGTAVTDDAVKALKKSNRRLAIYR